jgi:hypothetical protein
MTQQDFQNHLEQDHKKYYTNAELAFLTNRSRQKSGPLFTSCPLCGQDVQQAGGKLEKHIAGHLRSLALRSLPPVSEIYPSRIETIILKLSFFRFTTKLTKMKTMPNTLMVSFLIAPQ